jgi:hypothetical protein
MEIMLDHDFKIAYQHFRYLFFIVVVRHWGNEWRSVPPKLDKFDGALSQGCGDVSHKTKTLLPSRALGEAIYKTSKINHLFI